jgi:hypothetical protein
MKTRLDTTEKILDTNIDKLLVKSVLFAYTQEQYIRKAMEETFAKVDLPLEIILPDDYSTNLDKYKQQHHGGFQ